MYRFILVIILFSFSKIGFGQLKIVKTPVTDTLDVDLTKYIPPLYMLIDSAIANNPIVRSQLFESEAYEYALKAIKWDKFDLKAGTNWSPIINPYPQYTIDNDFTTIFDPIDDNNFVGFPSVITVQAQIRLQEWLTEKPRKMAMKARANTIVENSEHTKRIVANEITVLYNNLFMYQRMLAINQKAIQMGKIGVELGEEKFRNGQMELAELSQLYDLMTKYGLEYERVYAAYKSTFTDLERKVGIPLSKFKF